MGGDGKLPACRTATMHSLLGAMKLGFVQLYAVAGRRSARKPCSSASTDRAARLSGGGYLRGAAAGDVFLYPVAAPCRVYLGRGRWSYITRTSC